MVLGAGRHASRQEQSPYVNDPSMAVKKSDEEKVSEYMDKLEHPLKREIEAVRALIKSVDSRIGEHIKWNAPSYYYKEDMVTFHLRSTEQVHLVFHHPSIETISSPLLQGDYKGRRMAYFKNMEEVRQGEEELKRVMAMLIKNIG